MLPYFTKINGKRVTFKQWLRAVKTLNDYRVSHFIASKDMEVVYQRAEEKFGVKPAPRWWRRFENWVLKK